MKGRGYKINSEREREEYNQDLCCEIWIANKPVRDIQDFYLASMKLASEIIIINRSSGKWKERIKINKERKRIFVTVLIFLRLQS